MFSYRINLILIIASNDEDRHIRIRQEEISYDTKSKVWCTDLVQVHVVRMLVIHNHCGWDNPAYRIRLCRQSLGAQPWKNGITSGNRAV